MPQALTPSTSNTGFFYSRFKFFVYSAYVEGRTTDAVRVIAATKTRGADAVVCRLWLLDNRTITVKARVKVGPETIYLI